MAALWKTIGTTVYPSAPAPLAWTVLDLSALVGARKTWVLLDLVQTGGAAAVVAFRPNGDAHSWLSTLAFPGMGCTCVYINSSLDSGVLVETDSSGKVEWICTLANNIEIKLIGFVYGLNTYAGPAFHTGALGAGSNNKDVSSIVGSTRAVSFLKARATNAWAAGEDWICRNKYNDADDWAFTDTAAAAAIKVNASPNTIAHGLVSISGDTGILQLISDLGTGQGDIFLTSYVRLADGFLPPIPGNEVIYSGVGVGLPWKDLVNLPAAIGSQEGLVFLKVKQTAPPTSYTILGFRQDGTSYDHGSYRSPMGCGHTVNKSSMVVFPSSSIGLAEWSTQSDVNTYDLEVLGFIPSTPTPAPSVVRTLPDGVTTEYPDQILVSIDDVWGVDLTTVDLTVKPVAAAEIPAVVGGVVQSGFTGTVTQNTSISPRRAEIRLTSFPDFMNGRRYNFELDATSYSGVSL